AAEDVRCRQSGCAAAEDHDRRRMAGACRGSLRLRRQLLSNEHNISLALDAPAGNGIERGRAQRLTSREVETRVMPGTAHRVADDKAVGEWTVVVSAMRADREDALASPHEDDLVLTDVPGKRAAVGQ